MYTQVENEVQLFKSKICLHAYIIDKGRATEIDDMSFSKYFTTSKLSLVLEMKIVGILEEPNINSYFSTCLSSCLFI